MTDRPNNQDKIIPDLCGGTGAESAFKVGDRVKMRYTAGVITHIVKVGGDRSCFSFLTVKGGDGEETYVLPEWVRLIPAGGDK